MSPKQIEKALQRLHKLEKEMSVLGPVMRGSVVRIGTRNKQFYFSLNKDKKTRLIYLGKERVDQARRLSGNYKKLLGIIEKMTLLNMDLLKNGALK